MQADYIYTNNNNNIRNRLGLIQATSWYMQRDMLCKVIGSSSSSCSCSNVNDNDYNDKLMKVRSCRIPNL